MMRSYSRNTGLTNRGSVTVSDGLPSVNKTTPSAWDPLGVDGLAKEALDRQRRQIIAAGRARTPP